MCQEHGDDGQDGQDNAQRPCDDGPRLQAAAIAACFQPLHPGTFCSALEIKIGVVEYVICWPWDKSLRSR